MEKVVAVSEFCGFAGAVSYPSIGSVRLPDLEAIKKAEPEYILTFAQYEESVLIELQQMNIKVIVITAPQSLEQLREIYRQTALFFLGAIDPSVMLLDEPLSNLDANLREEMRFEIKGLQEKFGITVLYVTHDQEVALALSDRIAIMDTNGAIRQIGTPYEIFEQPADLFVFKFMGIANFLHVTEKAGKFCVGEGDQVVPWDAPTGNAASWVAGFRPSDVTISRDPQGLKGKIRRANFLGATMDYMVEIDGETLRTELETHHAINNNLMFEEGEECYITFKALHWFDAKQLEEVAE